MSKVLEELQESIAARDAQLSIIKQRERRAVVLVTTYSLAGWLLYVALWYFNLLPGGAIAVGEGEIADVDLLAAICKAIPLGLIPVL